MRGIAMVMKAEIAIAFGEGKGNILWHRCKPSAAIVSNTYAVQWPKDTWRRYPEVDRAGWFSVDEARQKILAAQAAFIDRLLAALHDAT